MRLLLSSWQQYSSLVSRFRVATNSFVACFLVYCDTVDFFHCVSANLLWFFWLGSCPVRCLLCCLSDGETQIWPGDLRLALCFWFVFLVVLIRQAACDHRRPCNSFLTYSFFSCKDRALERDRPYQREKKMIGKGLLSGL